MVSQPCLLVFSFVFNLWFPPWVDAFTAMSGSSTQHHFESVNAKNLKKSGWLFQVLISYTSMHRLWPCHLNLLGCEQALQLSYDDLTAAKRWVQVKACDAHRRGNNENERTFKEGMDTRGWPGVPWRAAQWSQQLPTCVREKVIKNERMSSYQKRLIDNLNLNPLENKKLVLSLEDKQRQEPAILYQTGDAFENGAQSNQV